MGCRMPIVDIPHKSTSKDQIPGPDCIYGENVETSCQQDHRNGGELACSPNHSKPHIFSSEREDSEIFLRGNNSLRDSKMSQPTKNSRTAVNLGATAPNRYPGGLCMDREDPEDAVLSCIPRRSI
ncbi:6631_t:CDS:2, partial [Paraglomus occultum]